ncbi:MAG: hypothetical protein ACKVRN_05385 [Pyrinomonadaceae bacterium]
MKSRIIFVLFVILAFTLPVVSQAKKFQINISITAKDEKMESDIKSYVARELRSLGDVDVVEVGDYTVKIAILKILARDGYEVGYAVSYTLIHNVVCQGNVYLDDIDGGLRITDTDSLRKTWEYIVTTFDTRVFEKLRKASKK